MPESVTRRRAGAVALALLAVALVVVLLAGGGDSAAPEGDPTTSTTGELATTPDPSGPAAELSREELVEAVILAGFEGDAPGAAGVEGLANRSYGGVLVATENWRGGAKGRKLLGAIGEASRAEPPPLIAVAQEGGNYRALADLPPADREIEIGDRGDPRLAQRWAEESGRALRDAGFDLNLGIVADVATLDSPIADRAFADDADLAAQMSAAAVLGCQEAGIACAVAHFPGLGAASADTEGGPASVGFDAATLQARDLVPFVAAFDAGAEATVVSHGLYGGIDPVTPASLSRPIVTGLLRRDLGFDGVAISDDLGAGAIEAVTTPAEAAVEALNAGIDLVQVADPDELDEVRRAIAAALEDGTLEETRVREAAARVLKLRRDAAGGAS